MVTGWQRFRKPVSVMAKRRSIAPPHRHPAIVREEFEEALRAAKKNEWEDKLNCHGREAEFADREDVPSVQWSDSACDGCPLRKLCREYADATRPSWGQYGGKFFVYGRSAHWAGNLSGENPYDSDGFFDGGKEWPVDWRQRELDLRTAPSEED